MLTETKTPEMTSSLTTLPDAGRPIAAGWSHMVGAAQGVTHYRIQGRSFSRIRYGTAAWDDEAAGICPTCEASKGQFHVPTCDLEQCPRCGERVASCACGLAQVSSFGEIPETSSRGAQAPQGDSLAA